MLDIGWVNNHHILLGVVTFLISLLGMVALVRLTSLGVMNSTMLLFNPISLSILFVMITAPLVSITVLGLSVAVLVVGYYFAPSE